MRWRKSRVFHDVCAGFAMPGMAWLPISREPSVALVRPQGDGASGGRVFRGHPDGRALDAIMASCRVYCGFFVWVTLAGIRTLEGYRAHGT